MPYLDGLPLASSVSSADIIAVGQGGTLDVPGTATTRQTTVAQLAGTLAFNSGTFISFKTFGAIGDGNSHPISTLLTFNGAIVSGWTLAKWQSVYSFVTALSNQADWVAIMAALSGGGSIVATPGTYLCDQPIVTSAQNVCVFGAGRENTAIVQITVGADGWQHGTPSTPAVGTFTARDISFKCQGIGGNGLNLVFNSNPSLFIGKCFTLDNVNFAGNPMNSSNYWLQPVLCMNVPRGVNWSRVNAWYSGPGIGANNAFQFNANAGSFSYVIRECLTSAYNFSFGLGYEGIGPSIEGCEWDFCESYNGNGFLTAINNIPNYFPPNFVIRTMGWQGNGQAVVMKNIQGIVSQSP